jgi:hypothetical protein
MVAESTSKMPDYINAVLDVQGHIKVIHMFMKRLRGMFGGEFSLRSMIAERNCTNYYMY